LHFVLEIAQGSGAGQLGFVVFSIMERRFYVTKKKKKTCPPQGPRVRKMHPPPMKAKRLRKMKPARVRISADDKNIFLDLEY
jgi:hypothetical protein